MAPPDADEVLSAIRLGWYVAELRGYCCPTGPRPQVAATPRPALPLRTGRGPADLRTEAEAVVCALTSKLTGDPDVRNRAKQVTATSRQLAAGTATTTWDGLAQDLYDFDGALQDALTAVSDTQCCGYLFGRGLSESYWALECPAGTPTDDAWATVFDDARVTELQKLAGRLGAYFPAYTASAVAKTLGAWAKLAAAPGWRKDEGAITYLYSQMRRWYELVVLLQDPSTLVKAGAVLRSWRTTLPVARAFVPELLVGGTSLAGVAWLVDLLSTTPSGGFFSSAVFKGALGVAGALGISGTTVRARLKNESQSITTRLRTDAQRNLISAQTLIIPDEPKRLPVSHDRRNVALVSGTGIPGSGRPFGSGEERTPGLAPSARRQAAPARTGDGGGTVVELDPGATPTERPGAGEVGAAGTAGTAGRSA